MLSDNNNNIWFLHSACHIIQRLYALLKSFGNYAKPASTCRYYQTFRRTGKSKMRRETKYKTYKYLDHIYRYCWKKYTCVLGLCKIHVCQDKGVFPHSFDSYICMSYHSNQKITFFFTRALFRFSLKKIAPLNYFAVAILELRGAFFFKVVFFLHTVLPN